MCIKEVNKILGTKWSQSCFTFICPESDWTPSNGSLDSNLFYLHSVHSVENGDLKLEELILSLIENLDNLQHNNHIQFNISYKMPVSFKLNNADFPLLSFHYFSMSCSSVWMSLPHATVCNYLSTNVSLSSKHFPNSSNELLPMVAGVPKVCF